MSAAEPDDSPSRLEGRTVIVTGASSGLGVAFAEGAARAGANVVLCARRMELLVGTARSVENIGRRALAVQADVSDVDACSAVVEAAIAEFGSVDVLINNAGIGHAAPATRDVPDDFRRVFDVNVNGAYWMAQACGRVMQPGSSIINIGSVLGSTTAGMPQTAYCSSKAAIIGMTRDLAQQWTGRKGIRVNALAPGFFLSEMTAQHDDAYLERMAARTPAGRLGEGHELAAAAVFLASGAASYISGVVLPVDGGFLTG